MPGGGGLFGGSVAHAVVEMAADTSRLEKDFTQARAKGTQATGDIGKSSTIMKAAVLAASVAAGAAMIKFAADAVSAASDLGESTNKVKVIFGETSAEILKFAKNSSTIGLAEAHALDATAAFGAMFDSAGLAEQASASMSIVMTKLAADMASFNNQDPSEMLEKLRSGLAGEAEPLRRFGVFISEARVQQEGLRLGLIAAGEEMTDQQKIQARYAIILKDTTKQQDDFNRTVGESLPNQLRVAKAQWTNFQASIGELIIPIMTELLKVFNATIETLNDIPKPVRNAVIVLSLLGATIAALGFGLRALRTGLTEVSPRLGEMVTGANLLKGALLSLGIVGLQQVINWMGEAESNARELAGALTTGVTSGAAAADSSMRQFADTVAETADRAGSHWENFWEGFSFWDPRSVLEDIDALRDEVDELRSSAQSMEPAARAVAKAQADWMDATIEVKLAQAGADQATMSVTEAQRQQKGASERLELALHNQARETRGATKASDSHEQQMQEERDAARQLRGAILSLTGGFLGIQGTALDLADASDALAQAQRKVNRMVDDGRKDTPKYRETMRDLRRAELDAIETKLALVQAVAKYLEEEQDGEPTRRDAIRLIRQMGKDVGITGGDVKDLTDDVTDLIHKHKGIPKHSVTKFSAPGLKSMLVGIESIAKFATDIAGSVVDITFKGGGGGPGLLPGGDAGTPIGKFRAADEAFRGALTVSSYYRAGDPGFHGLPPPETAVDFVGPNMVAAAQWLIMRYGADAFREMIHTPLGFGIDNGRIVPLSYWGLATNLDHYDHVHMARHGWRGWVTEPTLFVAGEGGRAEHVDITPHGGAQRSVQNLSLGPFIFHVAARDDAVTFGRRVVGVVQESLMEVT